MKMVLLLITGRDGLCGRRAEVSVAARVPLRNSHIGRGKFKYRVAHRAPPVVLVSNEHAGYPAAQNRWPSSPSHILFR